MDQARRTSKKAIRKRSSLSKTSRRKRSQRLVSPATPAGKSTTTSAVASTGVTISVVLIVTHHIRLKKKDETSPAQTSSSLLRTLKNQDSQRRGCYRRVNRTYASVATAKRSTSSTCRATTRCSKEQ